MIIIQLDSEQLSDVIQSAIRKVIGEKPQETKSESDELLTVKDAAAFLHLSVPTVYGLISKCELPVMKRSKRCYFSKVELINYLKDGRKKTLAETNSAANDFINRKAK